MGDFRRKFVVFASKMTYNVSGGALNSTQSSFAPNFHFAGIF